LVLDSGVARHDDDQASAPALVVRTAYHLALSVAVRAIQFPRIAMGTRRADRAAPAWMRAKVLLQIAAVVIGPSSEAHEPWIRQCLLGNEATNGVWIEEPKAIDKDLGCGLGYQRLEVR
jgi:hypothetical protein